MRSCCGGEFDSSAESSRDYEEKRHPRREDSVADLHGSVNEFKVI